MIFHPFPIEHPAAEFYEFTKPQHGMDGCRYVFLFTNGYGASVIRHSFSYGADQGLWEVAVIDHDGNLVYSTPVTDDVIGYLDELAVANTLDKICRLPTRLFDHVE